MNYEYLRKIWKSEEENAHIHGWDFSHISGRTEECSELPWDYRDVICRYLKRTDKLLDIDTGGGEFLLSLNHPYSLTSAVEGYPPNVKLCENILLPLGIDFKPSNDYSNLPFENDAFDVVINRHGAYDVKEIYRILKPNGVFITQQVGENNDREIRELLLASCQNAFKGMNLREQSKAFGNNGFSVLESGESFRDFLFYDVGALVWFAKIIQWEFPNFSVDSCFEGLVKAQQAIEKDGFIKTTTHRYMIVARKI